MRNSSVRMTAADSLSQTVGRRPSLAIRVRTRARRARLDAELAAGADPATSPEHHLRAQQLSSPAERSRFANRLVLAVGEAQGLANELASARRRRARDQVRDYADELLALAARLRGAERLPVEGLAMSARLVEDRRSPLYRADPDELGDAVRSIEFALTAPAAEPELREAA
jgi:hypothetical protein